MEELGRATSKTETDTKTFWKIRFIKTRKNKQTNKNRSTTTFAISNCTKFAKVAKSIITPQFVMMISMIYLIISYICTFLPFLTSFIHIWSSTWPRAGGEQWSLFKQEMTVKCFTQGQGQQAAGSHLLTPSPGEAHSFCPIRNCSSCSDNWSPILLDEIPNLLL